MKTETLWTVKRTQVTMSLVVLAILVPVAMYAIYTIAKRGSAVVAVFGVFCLVILSYQAIYGKPNLKDAWLFAIQNIDFEIDDESRKVNRKRILRISVLLSITTVTLACYLMLTTPLGGFFMLIAMFVVARQINNEVAFHNLIAAAREVWRECR